MVIKINYTSSDVYVSTSVSPVYVVVNYSGTTTGAAVWGQITGTLSDQTDLQTALDDKVPYTGATANVDLGGFSIKPSMVEITGINSGGTGGVLNIKKGNTRVIGGDDSANNLSLWAETGAFGFNDWVSGNLRNAKFSLLSITNNATRTYTLPNLDGTLALLSDITPGLTSVGLSMPSAFAVSNSPLTSNGTIAVTGAGTASQYIRGDGQLATLPSGSSGGSAVAYYLNGSVNQGTIGGSVYYEMNGTAVIGAGTDFSKAGNGLISQFLTDVADPNRLEIPAGNWNFEMYMSASSSGGNPAFYVQLLKYDGTTFTSIASSLANPEAITNGTTIDLYVTALAIPQTTLLSTDRLAIRVYIVNSTGGRTITMHTENSHLCEIITNFAGGVSALNGLTANTQYFATGTSGTDFAISSATDTHTFNLPTASATNRGALSSADWSTFSGKVGGSGASGQVAYWNGTSSQTGSNNLFWDAANSRLGIGTNTPSVKLDVYDAINSNYAYFTAGTTIMRFGSSVGGLGILGTDSNHELDIRTNSSSRIRITTGGNALVGTTTDSGQRLQVQGDAFIKGSGNTNASSGLLVQDSSSNVLFRIFNDGNLRLKTWTGGFGTIIGGNATTGTLFDQTLGNAGSHSAMGFNCDFVNTSGRSNHVIIQGNFNPTSASGENVAIHIARQVNQTGGANGITRGLYVNPTLTAAADWRSIEWSNNSGWGLYGAGTADSYLGGRLSVATTNTPRRLNIGQATGSTAASIGIYTSGGLASVLGVESITSNDIQIAGIAGIRFYSGTTIGNIVTDPTNERMRLTTAGRLLLGLTAESTFLLDVNGTARVSGASTLSGLITASAGLFVNGILDIYNDGSNGAIAMRTLTNTLCLRKYVKVLGDDGGFGNNNASAAFQIDGTNRGFLPPRLTTTQKNAIGTPAAGLQVYDTTLNQMSYYNGTTWVNF
jgi:hypothetical protein